MAVKKIKNLKENIMSKRMTKSKRFRIAICFGIVNILIVLFAIWQKHYNIKSLCEGLALINSPIIVYILGDSFRPSGFFFKNQSKENTKEKGLKS